MLLKFNKYNRNNIKNKILHRNYNYRSFFNNNNNNNMLNKINNRLKSKDKNNPKIRQI